MDYKALAAQAGKIDDQTETKAGGDFEYVPPVAGSTVGRLIEYIELGKHAQKPYQGKAKPDAEEVRLTFELLAPKNFKEIEVNGEKQKVSDIISIRLKKSLSEKASFKKLFNKMTYGRDGITHMAQMLNEPFLIKVHHNKSEDGKKVYANINDSEGVYHVGAPVKVVVDEDTMEETRTTLNVPAATRPIRIFLWDLANKEQWDTIFIDGTRKVKEGDKEVEVSRNWIQETVLSAKNYHGSPIEQVLSGLAKLPTEEKEKVTIGNNTSDDSDGSDPLADLDLN